ncbi:hypothetical protein DFJ74DRAFT_702297 [Hyaloraphidium curvatum]|nr:hypothetical protein DFJ74DRAFT_702297 [Hyaloraphidium curvatum]
MSERAKRGSETGSGPSADAVPPLFRSTDLGRWRRALDAYPAALAQVARSKYAKKPDEAKRTVELDRLLFEDLPLTVEARRTRKEKPVLTKDEVVSIVDWKMHRQGPGAKWRPNLLRFAEENSAEEYADAINSAEKRVPQLAGRSTREKATRGIIDALSKPKGIGPATSLAIGSVLSPALAFYSDEAVAAIGMPKSTYTPASAMAFLNKIWAKVEELDAAVSQTGGTEMTWTAKDVERALYVDWLASQGAVTLDGEPTEGQSESEAPKPKRQKK